MISANTRNRIQAISIEGNVAERYFAVTSETPRNTVDARISAIPLNGRSVRAGARRATGSLSGAGNGALASLAAAAGDDITAKLWQFRLRERHKNDNCIVATTPENRIPICTYGLRSPPATYRSIVDAFLRAKRYRFARDAQAAVQQSHLVKKPLFYNIGRLRGFGPRGNDLSSAAMSLSLSVISPAAELSAACSADAAFGIANTDALRVRNASAT
jgi:hypothetical protein